MLHNAIVVAIVLVVMAAVVLIAVWLRRPVSLTPSRPQQALDRWEQEGGVIERTEQGVRFEPRLPADATIGSTRVVDRKLVDALGPVRLMCYDVDAEGCVLGATFDDTPEAMALAPVPEPEPPLVVGGQLRRLDADEVPGRGATAAPERRERPAVDMRVAAMARIEWVRSDFERRRGDIIEVIEHHALFQMTDVHTREFEQYRMAVDDTDLSALVPEALRDMSTKLEVLYRAAVDNAERVGLDALRDPKLGTTATKLARTAADDRTAPSEREAARTKLEQALRELRLPVEPRVLDAMTGRRELTRATTTTENP